MNSSELKLEALKLAVSQTGDWKQKVEAARGYYEFLASDVGLTSGAPVDVSPTLGAAQVATHSESSEKPKAKAKKKIETLEAAPEAEKVVDVEAAEVAESPKEPEKETAQVDYKTLQVVIMKFVQQKGKQAALDILADFSVTTALDLPEAKYGEALEAFSAALAA